MTERKNLTLLYDGECPICMREISFLRARDRDNALRFEDISASDFSAAKYDLSQSAVEAQMHGVLPDGTLVRGPEVFRRAYQEVGLGWLLKWTKWPIISPLIELAYLVFAKNRKRLGNIISYFCNSQTK